MQQIGPALLGLAHRVAYATAIAGAVWLFYSIPFDGPLEKSPKVLLKLFDLPIATASQLLPCNARGVDLWFRIGPGESACPHYSTMSESLRSHMRVGVLAYVLLFYLPSLLLAARRRWRGRRPAALSVAALLILGFATSPGFAARRGPSTPEERSKAIDLVRALETDPLNETARDSRRWLIAWLSEIPDITVELCPALLGENFEVNKKYAAELSVQQSLSGAAFIIEHPERAQEKLAVALAGVEGTLKTYEAVLMQKPKAHFKSLDALLEAKSKGTLESIVARNMKACT
ncbi:MAG: hypothetical protein ABIU84_18070 [Thermoanaerobaculia bacterium]